MLYEYIVKIFGTGIAAILSFYPFSLQISDDTLITACQLNKPVTQEIERLVRKGFVFSTETEVLAIINNERVYSKVNTNTLLFDSLFRINLIPCTESHLQETMGYADLKISHPLLKDGDVLTIFAITHICPDSVFKQGCGLQTSVLWDFFVPRRKTEYQFAKGQFIQQ